MSTIRLYIDEDLEEDAFVDALRQQRFDVQTVTEAARRDDTDSIQMEHAHWSGRVLCSYNIRDFSRIHGEWLSEGRNHSGLILLHQQRLSHLVQEPLGQHLLFRVRWAIEEGLLHSQRTLWPAGILHSGQKAEERAGSEVGAYSTRSR